MANDTITEGREETNIAKIILNASKKFLTRFERSENRVYFTRISKVGKCAAFDFGPLKSRENEWIFVKPNFT